MDIDIEKQQQYYTTEFTRQNEYIKDGEGNIEKITFVVSTGVFILSINYITGLKDSHLVMIWLLILSWGSLTFSILIQIAYFHFLSEAGTYCIKKLNEWAGNGCVPSGFNTDDLFKSDNHLKRAVKRTDVARSCFLGFLVLGVISIVIFTSVNLLEKNGSKKIDQQQQSSQPVFIYNYYGNTSDQKTASQ